MIAPQIGRFNRADGIVEQPGNFEQFFIFLNVVGVLQEGSDHPQMRQDRVEPIDCFDRCHDLLIRIRARRRRNQNNEARQRRASRRQLDVDSNSQLAPLFLAESEAAEKKKRIGYGSPRRADASTLAFGEPQLPPDGFSGTCTGTTFAGGPAGSISSFDKRINPAPIPTITTPTNNFHEGIFSGE